MEYRLVEAKNEADQLAQEVNQYIQEGWEPIGGVAVSYSPQSTNWWFYQAMVRNGEGGTKLWDE